MAIKVGDRNPLEMVATMNDAGDLRITRFPGNDGRVRAFLVSSDSARLALYMDDKGPSFVGPPDGSTMSDLIGEMAKRNDSLNEEERNAPAPDPLTEILKRVFGQDAVTVLRIPRADGDGEQMALPFATKTDIPKC